MPNIEMEREEAKTSRGEGAHFESMKTHKPLLPILKYLRGRNSNRSFQGGRTEILFPSMLQLESAARCNARCSFCPVGLGLKRNAGEMSDALFEKILTEADELGIRTVFLFLNGEPFVFGRFFDWLEKLRGYGMNTGIFSNAAALNRKQADRLAGYSDVVTQICFSVSGRDAESERRIMSLDFDRVEQNVRYFLGLNSGIRYWISMPDIEGRDYQREWRAHWGPIVGAGKLQVNPLWNYAGNVPHAKTGALTSFCGKLDPMTVLWDGRVNLCCMDAHGEVILGDLNRETILEVYNGEPALHYRSRHKAGRQAELKLCNVCNVR